MHPKGSGCRAAALSQVDIKIGFCKKIRFCGFSCVSESCNIYLSVSTVSVLRYKYVYL